MWCCSGLAPRCQESIYEPRRREAEAARLDPPASAIPLDKTTDVGVAINSKMHARNPHHGALERAMKEAPISTSRRAASPRRATGSCHRLNERRAALPHRAERSLPVPLRADGPPHSTRGSGREGEQHAVLGSIAERLYGEGVAHPFLMAQAAPRRVCGRTGSTVSSDFALRLLQGSPGLRVARAPHVLEPYLRFEE